ncbi:hypothetical protein NWF32_24930 [Pseudomonas qingdaonensis]|nr:hypothetical protein [Pseudomonas qingdaonensis]
MGGLRNGQLLKRSAEVFQPADCDHATPEFGTEGGLEKLSTGQDKIIFGSNRPVAGKNFNTPLNYFRRRTSVNAVPREILIFRALTAHPMEPTGPVMASADQP